jgi:GNAT superfamily N-acetyltransferase
LPYKIKRIQNGDREAIGADARARWGEEKIIVHEEVFFTGTLPGLKAMENDEILGFLHYLVRDDQCEIITLASLSERQGIGRALVQAVEEIARTRSCWKLTMTTTNDNLKALAFYQRHGFALAGLGLGLVDKARKQKPAIPLIGNHHIPIHDEIYLEKVLNPS